MKRNRLLILIGAAALAALIAIPASSWAHRGGRTFNADMDGFHEVPAISTGAFGEFDARIDPKGTGIEYELNWSGLEGGNVLFAHLHLGQKDVNGGVSTFLCGGGGKPPCTNAPSGSATGVILPADILGPANQGIAAGEFQELVRAIEEGAVYANLHTAQFPGGEIRGQVK